MFVRVYSGRIAEGDDVWNADLGKKEKVARVLLMHAVQKKRVPALGAGQIFAVVGLKETRTGDTLSDPGAPAAARRDLGATSRSSRRRSRRPRCTTATSSSRRSRAIADEDPSFRFGEDAETGQLLVSGMGELHLEIVAERLRREFGLQVRTGQPQVLMRETLTAEAEGEGTFEREIDDAPVFGHVDGAGRAAAARRRAPVPVRARRRTALPFLREETRRLVEEGAREAAEGGVLEGYTLQDVEVVRHRRDVARGGVEAVRLQGRGRRRGARGGGARAPGAARADRAGRGASRRARASATVMNGLDARRGTILDVADRGAAVKVIQGEAPLRRMFGYATELRSATQGRALFTMRFDRFDAVP